MAGDCDRRAWASDSSQTSAGRTLASLLEADSHSPRCAGGSRGRTPVRAISESRPHSDRLAGNVCADFPINGPAFAALDRVTPPQLLVGLAVLAGLVTATWLRSYCGLNGLQTNSPGLWQHSTVCTRRIPVVSSLAAAISDVGFDAADYHLDCEYYPRVHSMAFAHTRASVGSASWLGHAGGIRMRGSGRCNSRSATD